MLLGFLGVLFKVFNIKLAKIKGILKSLERVSACFYVSSIFSCAKSPEICRHSVPR